MQNSPLKRVSKTTDSLKLTNVIKGNDIKKIPEKSHCNTGQMGKTRQF